MREGWEYKKLGQVCTSDLGKTLNKSKDRGELHPYLCSINILWDKIDLSTLKQACFEADEQEKYSVRKGDLLVCEGGDTGRSAIWDRDETILYQNALHRLRFHESVSPKFVLFYLLYLKDIGEIDNKYSKGVTIKHLVKKALLSIPLPIPPKSTQLSIVSELDKINELIRIKKEQLKDYDTLAQSIFYEMFGDPVENEKGWEVKELIETVIPECKISYGIVQPGEHVEDGVPIVRPVDMLQTFISKDGLKKTTKEISNSYNRTILTGKELLICVRGTTGVVSLVDESLKGANVTRGIAPLLFSMDVERWFMYYQIKTPSVRGVISSLTRGIALKQINMSDLRKIQVILPPLPLQHSFAQKIEQIEQQKAAIQKTITDLETLLAARMQYWFD